MYATECIELLSIAIVIISFEHAAELLWADRCVYDDDEKRESVNCPVFLVLIL